MNNNTAQDDLTNRQLHIVLVNAVVFKGNQILVGRRSAKEVHAAGYWTIPGGKLERTEDCHNNVIEETGKREVLEETGITIQDNPTIIDNNTFIRSTGHHVVVMVLSGEYQSGNPTSTEELEEVKWINENEIDALHMVDNVKNYVKKAIQLRREKIDQHD